MPIVPTNRVPGAYQEMTSVVLACFVLVLALADAATPFQPRNKTMLATALDEWTVDPCLDGCDSPIGAWNISLVTDLSGLFASAPRRMFNSPGIGEWDTSKVTSMYAMFYQAAAFNQPIGKWDTSKAANMEFMFVGAAAFNQPIGKWDTEKVTDMAEMFANAVAFDQPIGEWDTSKATSMYGMFNGAAAFNQPIGKWDTSMVTTMNSMFYLAAAFNQPIGKWDTSEVLNRHGMFNQAVAFNQTIGEWDTSKMTAMSGMFNDAAAFNQPIGKWDTSKVATMWQMFDGAAAFNQPIGKWDTSKVVDMDSMFENAIEFNQPLIDWDINSRTRADNQYAGSAMAPCNKPKPDQDQEACHTSSPSPSRTPTQTPARHHHTGTRNEWSVPMIISVVLIPVLSAIACCLYRFMWKPQTSGLRRRLLSSSSRRKESIVEIRDLAVARQRWRLPMSNLSPQAEWERIAAGEGGTVYKASFHGEPVAVKELFSLLLDPEDRDDFDKEVDALRALHHPNIPRFFGIAEVKPGSSHFLLVTEYVPHSLDVLIRSKAKQASGRPWGIPGPTATAPLLPITRRHVVGILAGVAQAMLHLERKRMVHRDIKPNNILISAWPELQAKLCDFGLARIQAAGDETMTKMIGTAAFMSPELFGPAMADEEEEKEESANDSDEAKGDDERDEEERKNAMKDDVFAFGVTIWAGLEFTWPWQGKSNLQICVAVCKGERPEFSADVPWPPVLRDLVAACWHQNPSRRSTVAFIAEVLKILAGPEAARRSNYGRFLSYSPFTRPERTSSSSGAAAHILRRPSGKATAVADAVVAVAASVAAPVADVEVEVNVDGE